MKLLKCGMFEDVSLNFLSRSGAKVCTLRAACVVHLLFATPLGLAASLRPDGFVPGAVSFVRRTLARSVFLGFQIGVPRCKSWKPRRKKGKISRKIPTNRHCKN